ncbi:hypothetical protein KI387_022013, partial [Taxus chinensis]
MYRIKANCRILCDSCNKDLGIIRHNVNVANFLYCDECVKARKVHPENAFLQSWDEDIFREPFCDFSVEGSDGGFLRVHKAVLAGKSKVFKAMLRSGMSESTNAKAKITDMTTAELRPLLNFLYTGTVNQRSLECHGVALYKASHKYDLPLLRTICDRFLESNVIRDIRGVFELAVNYDELENLQEAVLPYIFSQGFVKSNPASLVVKSFREASMFECYREYRKNNLNQVSYLMELSLYRVADHLNLPGYREHEVLEEQDNMAVALWNDYKADGLTQIEDKDDTPKSVIGDMEVT